MRRSSFEQAYGFLHGANSPDLDNLVGESGKKAMAPKYVQCDFDYKPKQEWYSIGTSIVYCNHVSQSCRQTITEVDNAALSQPRQPVS
jgi:hypothetical protein